MDLFSLQTLLQAVESVTVKKKVILFSLPGTSRIIVALKLAERGAVICREA